MAQKRHLRVWAATFVILVFAAVGETLGQEIQVVSPSETADEEGNAGVNGGGAVKFQWLYPAADFTSLPPSHRTISGIAFRSDEDNTFTRPVSGPAQFVLSTTDAVQLDPTFANNIGSDAKVAFDGTLTWQTDDLGPGPRDFDFIVPFNDRFSYDPSQGKNLLVQFIAPENWDNVGNWRIDRHDLTTGNTTYLVGFPTDIVGTIRRNRLWPTQFTFVPEPLTAVSLTLGLCHIACWRRRTRGEV